LQTDDFARMQREQLEITRGVARLLKRGGILVYSTCSLESEENDGVAERLATELSGGRLIEKRFNTPFTNQCDGAFAAKLSTGTV
jgi:16S rRNA (cytosine967-C5)-methyltransferase